jgi:hypothetical protein
VTDFRVDADHFNKLKRGCEDAGRDAAGRAMRGGGRGRGGSGAAKWRRVSEDQGGAGGAAGAGAGAARAGGAAGARAEEERPKKKGKSGGFSAPVYLKPALAIFMGKDSAGRPEVVKEIWRHAKELNLQDPKDKRYIVCDERLFAVFFCPTGRARTRDTDTHARTHARTHAHMHTHTHTHTRLNLCVRLYIFVNTSLQEEQNPTDFIVGNPPLGGPLSDLGAEEETRLSEPVDFLRSDWNEQGLTKHFNFFIFFSSLGKRRSTCLE